MILNIPIYIWLGIFPILFFVFSVIKPSSFTKNVIWMLIGLLSFLFLIRLSMETYWKTTRFSAIGWINGLLMIMSLCAPFLFVLLIAVAGTRAIMERCPRWLAIPLNILNASGCTGLIIFLIVFLYWPAVKAGHGIDDVLIYLKFLGGIISLIVLGYSFILWKHRLEDH